MKKFPDALAYVVRKVVDEYVEACPQKIAGLADGIVVRDAWYRSGSLKRKTLGWGTTRRGCGERGCAATADRPGVHPVQKFGVCP